jgi:hypothetical protein
MDVFHLPRPNEFIPKRLDVDQREVSQVCFNPYKALLSLTSSYSPSRVPI